MVRTQIQHLHKQLYIVQFQIGDGVHIHITPGSSALTVEDHLRIAHGKYLARIV